LAASHQSTRADALRRRLWDFARRAPFSNSASHPIPPLHLEAERPAGRSHLADLCIFDTVICMRTTLDLDDAVLRAAKKRAAEEGKTLTRLIEEALRARLAPGPRSKRHRLQPLTKRGRPVQDVDVEDRDALYERMEGRR
jgi:hypothetical protein